jgi:O-antigen/teichoic acid export membrane protein
MGTFEDLRRLTKHSLIYGVGHILSRGIGFLLLPLYTNVLSPAEYGIVALVFTFIAFMNILFLYGLDSAFLRFYALEKGADEKKKILATTMSMTALTSVSLFLLLFLLCEPLSRLILGRPETGSLLKMASGILFFDTLSTFPYLLLRLEEKSAKFISYRLVNVLLTLGLNIYLVAYLKKGVYGVFLSNLIASAFILAILLPSIWRRFAAAFSGFLVKELLKFGLPFIPAGLASMSMELIDRYMLRHMKDLEVVGVYNAGYKLGLFMLLVVMAFKFAWQPFFLGLGGEEARAKKSFAAVLTYFLLVTSFLLLVVSFFVDDLVRMGFFGVTIFGPEFWSGTQVVPVILLAHVMMGLYLIFLPGIYLRKKTKFVPLFTGVGAVINILGNLLLIPRWGMQGAAWATFLGYFAMALALYATVQRFYPVHYQFGRAAKVIFISALVFVTWRWLGRSVSMRILLLVVCYPLGLILTGFFNRAEWQRLRNALGLRRKG